MSNTYTAQEIEHFLNGMAYAASLIKYRKAATRINQERTALALLNEQRHARINGPFLGKQVQSCPSPTAPAWLDRVCDVANHPMTRTIVWAMAAFMGSLSVSLFITGA